MSRDFDGFSSAVDPPVIPLGIGPVGRADRGDGEDCVSGESVHAYIIPQNPRMSSVSFKKTECPKCLSTQDLGGFAPARNKKNAPSAYTQSTWGDPLISSGKRT